MYLFMLIVLLAVPIMFCVVFLNDYRKKHPDTKIAKAIDDFFIKVARWKYALYLLGVVLFVLLGLYMYF